MADNALCPALRIKRGRRQITFYPPGRAVGAARVFSARPILARRGLGTRRRGGSVSGQGRRRRSTSPDNDRIETGRSFARRDPRAGDKHRLPPSSVSSPVHFRPLEPSVPSPPVSGEALDRLVRRGVRDRASARRADQRRPRGGPVDPMVPKTGVIGTSASRPRYAPPPKRPRRAGKPTPFRSIGRSVLGRQGKAGKREKGHRDRSPKPGPSIRHNDPMHALGCPGGGEVFSWGERLKDRGFGRARLVTKLARGHPTSEAIWAA